jgi:hypothetical protein
MSDRKSPKFSTLPGILTGIATLVTAGAAVAAIVVGGSGESKPDRGSTNGSTQTIRLAGGSSTAEPKDEYTPADWARDADEICAIVYDNVRALGILDDPNATWQLLPQLLEISAQGNERIAALERPKDAADKIAESLKQATIAETALRDAYDAFNLGDAASGMQYWAVFEEATTLGQQLDTELGANVCARGA